MSFTYESILLLYIAKQWGQAWRSVWYNCAIVNEIGWGYNLTLEEIKSLFALVSRRAVLSSVTEHTMPPEFGGKCETECLTPLMFRENIFPLPTLRDIEGDNYTKNVRMVRLLREAILYHVNCFNFFL